MTRMRSGERKVERKRWTRALRPMLALAGAVALGGCGGDGRPSRYYGGGYGGPGYYGSPYYGGGYGPGYDRYYGPRGYYGGGYRGGSRTENWSQGRLQQHWIDQSRRVR
jgi:hypothetical protein